MRLIDADALSDLLVKTYETAPTEKALLFVALLLKNNEQVPTVEAYTPEQVKELVDLNKKLSEKSNPKQQETIGKYTVMQDSLNLRKYIVKPVEKLQAGYEYRLKIPHRKFRDINGFYNDSTDVKVSLPNDDKLSTMFLNLANVNNKYIIDLLNEKRTEVLRSYIIDKDQTLTFPYLKAGKYSIRITEDINRNGIVDTGILLEHKQPEKVRFYKLEDGTFLIEIPEMTELEQNIDVMEMFK